MTVIDRARPRATTRSGFRSLFISPIKTPLGALGTATGDPWALTNNGCCDAFDGVHEIKYDAHDAANNNVNTPNWLILLRILRTELTTRLLSPSYLRRSGITVSSGYWFQFSANGHIMPNLTKGPHMSKTDLISIEKIEKAIYH
jgi:hypothetical protein